jgi:predicted PurR-regulated permease PerM
MSAPTVIIKSRLPWETLFVQPLTLLTDNGMIGGTFGQCQKISMLYDTVVKTGGVNFPPTGPTPPAPAFGNMKGLETSFFIGYKAAEIMNFIKALPALLMAELKKLIDKYVKKLKKLYEKWKKKFEPLIKKIEKIIKIAKALIKVTLLFMQGKIKEGIAAGAEADLPGFKWLQKKIDSIPTMEELMKEIKKIISKIKAWINKKLEPLKKKLNKIKEWIENKLKEIKDKILKAIARRIATAALKKIGYTAAQAQAASGTYIDSVESAKAMIQAKILSIKAKIQKIIQLVKNVAKIALWVAAAVVTARAVVELIKQIPKLKELLIPPKPNISVPNVLGFGLLDTKIPPDVAKKIFKKLVDKIEVPALPPLDLNLGVRVEIPSLDTEGATAYYDPNGPIVWDPRSEKFNLPKLPVIPNIVEEVEKLIALGWKRVMEIPAIKRRVVKLKIWIEKKKKKIEEKLKRLKKKVEAAIKFIKDLKQDLIDKAKAYAIKLLISMLPPRGADPTEKLRILKKKIKKVQDLIAKIKKIKDNILFVIKMVLKVIKDILKKIAAALAIIALLTKYAAKPLVVGPLYQAAEIANEHFNAGIDTSLTPAEIRKWLIRKILGKYYPRYQKWLDRWKKRLDRWKKRLMDRLRPIIAKIKSYIAFIKALIGAAKALLQTNSGKLIATALSIGLILYWTGASVALPGGRVLFPGLPLQALPKINGKSATDLIAIDIFNEKSELSTSDKYRSLANVFETHMKTVAGLWVQPGSPPITIPWVSYG